MWAAASLHLTDGRIIRFGGDEKEAENQPSNIQYDTSNPGGFGSGSITLPRPENLAADDAKLFSHVEIYGPTGTLYEGFVTGVPQVGTNEIQLNLSGWVSALDRIETFREVFVDRDLSRWTGPSVTRTEALHTLFNHVYGPNVSSDTTNAIPALVLGLQPGDVNGIADAFYDAGPGCEVESMYYDMTSVSTSSYIGNFRSYTDDAASDEITGSDLLTGTDSSATGTFTPSTPQRYGGVAFYFLGGTVGTTETSMTVRRLAVFGNHGLTKRGTAPNEGYFASDIVGYVISQCPSLNFTAGDSVETTAFVIPHLTFTEDTSLRAVVEQVTALGGNQNVPNDWGVYEGREFYWRSPGTYGRTWNVRRDHAATSSSDGPDADRRVAGVKINYTDAAGTSLSVGPPGSNSDYETTDLLDNDPNNPAHRLPGAFKSESVGICPIEDGYTYSRLAVNIGTMILNERNRLDWRGSINVTGEAEDENGNTFPVAAIRAGDRIIITDGDATPRTVVSTSYDHDTLTCSAAIGAAPDSLESLLGQLAAVTDLIAE